MKLLILRPVGGLGNRLITIASAKSYALKTNRKLLVLWDVNSDAAIKLEDILSVEGIKIININLLNLSLFLRFISGRIASFSVKSDREFQVYLNNIDKTKWDKHFIDIFESQRIMYITSCRRFFSYTNELFNNTFKFRNDFIKTQIPKEFLKDEFIGIHIRRGDHVKVIKTNRLELFEIRISQILQKETQERFYLASDSEDVLVSLKSRYPNSIFYLQGAKNRNDSNGINHAFIELYILSKAKYIIGSKGSTFSVLASKFGNNKLDYVV
jgi:hypothetical protein